TCPYCKGSGYIKKVQNTIFGQQVVQTVCSNCGGKGKIVGDKCKTCRGSGKVNKDASVSVNIPAGIDSGMKMTIRNEGNSGENGGGRGDLVLVLYVNDTDKYKRVGNDLYLDTPVGFYDATCGAELCIETMKGIAKCKLPEGTQTGTKIRLKGYGMRVLQRESYGDLYLVVKVETPKGLNSKQAKLLKEFEESLSDTQYPQMRKFKKQ
ncbi:MAG: DnaJ C-terminal domain-containing protein, partial [Clostridia bacterium]